MNTAFYGSLSPEAEFLVFSSLPLNPNVAILKVKTKYFLPLYVIPAEI